MTFFFSMCFLFALSDQMGNKGAYIHLRGSDLKPEFHQFIAVVSGITFFFIYVHSFLSKASYKWDITRLWVEMQQEENVFPELPYMAFIAVTVKLLKYE